MKRFALFFSLISVVVFSLVFRCPAQNAEEGVPFSLNGKSEDIEKYWRKNIPLTVTAILTNTSVREQDVLCLRLETALRIIDDERLLSLEPAERERFAQTAIGNNDYQALEDKLLKQLAEGSKPEQISAAWALGCVLFSSRSEKLLKEAVFSGNRELQMNAVQALSVTGVSGADDLQLLFLLSGSLPNMDARFLIERMNSPMSKIKIGRHALDILRNNKNNPIVASGLIEALRTRSDFKKTAADLLKSEAFKVANSASSGLEGVARENFVSGLLFSLTVGKLPEDPELLDVLRYYANDTTHQPLYGAAMRYFERSGEGEAFFKKLLQNPDNPPRKIQYLNDILQRIQQDKRLQFEEETPPPAKK